MYPTLLFSTFSPLWISICLMTLLVYLKDLLHLLHWFTVKWICSCFLILVSVGNTLLQWVHVCSEMFYNLVSGHSVMLRFLFFTSSVLLDIISTGLHLWQFSNSFRLSMTFSFLCLLKFVFWQNKPECIYGLTVCKCPISSQTVKYRYKFKSKQKKILQKCLYGPPKGCSSLESIAQV